MPLTHTARRRTGSPTYFPNQGKAAASYHIGIIDILQVSHAILNHRNRSIIVEPSVIGWLSIDQLD
jgi:hypothetical protein